jgi:hypothetical protein
LGFPHLTAHIFSLAALFSRIFCFQPWQLLLACSYYFTGFDWQLYNPKYTYCLAGEYFGAPPGGTQLDF